MRFGPLALPVLLALAGIAHPAPPASNPYATEVLAALADARRLDPVTAARTRYLSLAQVPERDRDEWRKVVELWANNLSREAEFGRLRRVTPTVYALLLDDYGWLAEVWDKLADEDPYLHVQIKVAKGGQGPWFYPAKAGRKAGYQPMPMDRAGNVTALAPWLPTLEVAELVALTQSAAPLVRGDWWFSRAGIQFGRVGTGYYDFLQVKARADFEKLVGLDVKASQAVKREVAGIVARSGVGNFPRQIFRFQSITGGYWQTRDVITDNKDARNAIRQLDQDYKHEAEEIFGVLPNGLYAFFLGNAAGVRQDSAPDGIGFDHTAPGRDGKIHVGVSCVRCHVEGLRPIQDWGRRVYRGPLALSSPDPVQLRRLTQIYLGELQEWLDDDTALYARKLKRLTGWKTEEAAKAIGRTWSWYVEADLLPADLAAEFGIDEKEYLSKLRAYYRANQLGDPVLASHLADPPIPIRRDDVEQIYPLVAPVILSKE